MKCKVPKKKKGATAISYSALTLFLSSVSYQITAYVLLRARHGNERNGINKMGVSRTFGSIVNDPLSTLTFIIVHSSALELVWESI